MSQVAPYLNQLGKRVVFYLGGAWVIIEASSFLIELYDLDPVFINLIILLIFFGLPATIILSTFKGRFNWKAVSLQVINTALGLGVIFYYVIHPTSMEPENLRVLKLKNEQKSELAKLNSVAVLPFLNNIGNDQDYLIAGMHDGLITEIGKLGSINVRSRTSVMPFEDSNQNIQQIADKLNVDALIETSLTRIDTLITLNIKLISVNPEETVLWTYSYDGHLGEIPNLFREVTKNVALKINKAITIEEEKRLSPHRVIKPEAYEAFLKGNYYTSLLTLENFNLANKYFKKSIELDSSLIEGYTGLSILWASMKQMGYIDVRMANDTIAYYLNKAISIEPDSYLVASAQATHYTWGTFEWDKAGEAWEKSIMLNPNFTPSRTGYAHYLMIMNNWEEAWEQARYAENLDPESPWVIGFVGIMYLFDGKMLSAAKSMEKLKKVAPDHPLVTEVYMEKEAAFGNYDEAIRYAKIFLQRSQVDGIADIIDEHYASSDFETAISKVVEKLENERNNRFISSRILNQLYRMLGDDENQIRTMIWMFEESDPNFPYLGVKTNESLQKDERYVSIMKEAGLW